LEKNAIIKISILLKKPANGGTPAIEKKVIAVIRAAPGFERVKEIKSLIHGSL
jgi:hypothetical protein